MHIAYIYTHKFRIFSVGMTNPDSSPKEFLYPVYNRNNNKEHNKDRNKILGKYIVIRRLIDVVSEHSACYPIGDGHDDSNSVSAYIVIWFFQGQILGFKETEAHQ